VTRADQLNAAVNGQTADLAKEKEAQLGILQGQKDEATQQKTKDIGELNNKIGIKEQFIEHVKIQEGKINVGSIELTSWLANEKKEKNTQLSNMNEKKNSMTTAITALRTKERETKESEISTKSKNQAVSSQEEELKAERTKLQEVFQKSNDGYGRAHDKLLMVTSIILKDHGKELTTKAKERSIKQDMAYVKKKALRANGADKAAKEENEKATVMKNTADKTRTISMQKRNKAEDEEKKSKNDALERTKKAETSGIHRALEVKVKAQQSVVYAYQKRYELFEHQYVLAKEHHDQIQKSLDKAISQKNRLSEEEKLPDSGAVTQMVVDRAEKFSTAEKAQKAAEVASDKEGHTELDAKTFVQVKVGLVDKAAAEFKRLKDQRDIAKKFKDDRQASYKESGDQKDKTAFDEAEEQYRLAAQKSEESEAISKNAQTKREDARKVAKLVRGKATKALEEKSKAEQDARTAQQENEAGAKIQERFVSLTHMITERTEKRVSANLGVQTDERVAKKADDDFKREEARCKKVKDENANIGKDYAKLKGEMRDWAEKNPWLKQDPQATPDDGVGDMDAKPDEQDVGEPLDDDTSDVDIPDDSNAEMPPWVRRNTLELIQEEEQRRR